MGISGQLAPASDMSPVQNVSNLAGLYRTYPAHNPFVLGYGGMAYRGAGGQYTSVNTPVFRRPLGPGSGGAPPERSLCGEQGLVVRGVLDGMGYLAHT